MQPYYDHDGVTIYHGDSLDVIDGIDASSIDMICSDPPYGNSNNDGDLNSVLNPNSAIPIANDTWEEFTEVLDALLIGATRILKPESAIALCSSGGGGSGNRLRHMWLPARLDQKGLQFYHSCVWDKGQGIGWRYRRYYEFVHIAHLEGGTIRWADKERGTPNLIRVSKPKSGAHPNEKPIQLPSYFIQTHTFPGDLVLDPIMGSGTTLVAAKRLGRRAIGVELEERYCETAAKRLAQGVLL